MALQEHEVSPTEQYQMSQPGQVQDSLIYTAMFSCEACPFREDAVLPPAHGTVSRYFKERLLERMWKGDLPLAQLWPLRGARVVRAHPSPLLLTGHTAVVWQGQTHSSRMCLLNYWVFFLGSYNESNFVLSVRRAAFKPYTAHIVLFAIKTRWDMHLPLASLEDLAWGQFGVSNEIPFHCASLQWFPECCWKRMMIYILISLPAMSLLSCWIWSFEK